jgi:lysophospholipase L1-like esterase
MRKSEKAERRRWLPWWKSGLFALVPLLVLEAVLRLVPVPAGIQPHEFFDQDYSDPLHLKDPELFWRLAPDVDFQRRDGDHSFRWRINSQGLRAQQDYPEAVSSAYRILCVGDSVTFGWLVEEHEAYPARLQKLLVSRGMDVEVINAGVPGYSSHQVARYLPELLRFEPDLVVTYLGINDSSPASRPDSRRGALVRMDLLAGRLATYQHLAALLRRAKPSPSGPSDRTALRSQRVFLETFVNNVRSIEETTETAGADLLFIRPLAEADGSLVEVWPPPKEDGQFESARSDLIGVEARHLRLDLTAVFGASGSGPSQTLVPGDTCHWNGVGHSTVAEGLANLLLESWRQTGGGPPPRP